MQTLRSIHHLPLYDAGLKNLPAVPVLLDGLAGTLFRLLLRELETSPAKKGLSTTYTINNETATAHDFMYGKATSSPLVAAKDELIRLLTDSDHALKAFHDAAFGGTSKHVPPADPRSLTTLSLDAPDQWAMSWTTFQDIYRQSSPLLPTFASSLQSADEASRQFWPTIARYGLAYNLLVLQKVGTAQIDIIKSTFQAVWTPEMDALYTAGALYAIDMRIFETVQPQNVDGFDRFTPSTITLLQQDPQSKALTPVAIRVAGHADSNAQIYTRRSATEAAWLYALQAAKTSITVYGIWLGHVYHWHIVTAAMQMTMYNTVPSSHALYQLLAPQSQYLIAFDEVLIVLWSYIAPPTSISTPVQFLQLANTFASDRSFFDDDPTTTLEKLGLQQADFTITQPWDQYPIVEQLLTLWHATDAYVSAFVDATYANDAAVAGDTYLQAWMAASTAESEGNIRGLPTMDSKTALTRVLTSLIYRITVHGTSRLNRAANPGLTFVANFPPCLQDTAIPAPESEFDTKRLLGFLPKTGTIGQMATFYYTFVFSSPYEPFIPPDGVEANLFFPGGMSDRRNQALAQYRTAVEDFIKAYEPEAPQLQQWPLNIET